VPCVDASLAGFSLEKAFKQKSVKIDFLLRGIHTDPQHSAVGCKVCQNLVFNSGVQFAKYDLGLVFSSLLEKPAIISLVFLLSESQFVLISTIHLLSCEVT